MKDLIIGTAGHIDHGKTSLVKALTGIDADRLEEEKRRGITIDIGFAHLTLGPWRLGFIDVPGHEKFVKNMLAGAGGIRLVMLVVAADESVMPQTVEHFNICRLLEIPAGIVVITKSELVDDSFLELVEDDIRQLVDGSFLENAPVVAVDSVSGKGVEELKAVLSGLLEMSDSGDPSPEADARVFRMPIDRVFTIRGFGTVVTGTPGSGSIDKDNTVAIQPTGLAAKVRGIQVFNKPTEIAHAGQRTALNLSGIEKHELKRGMIVTPSRIFTPASVFDALVHLLDECRSPLKKGTPIRFHAGSGEFIGRLYPMVPRELQPGSRGVVQIRLTTSTLCCSMDHFILRSYSPATTFGGGIILDNAPPRRNARERRQALPHLSDLLEIWSEGEQNLEPALMEYLVWSRGATGMTMPSLRACTGLEMEALSKRSASMEQLVKVPQEPLLLLHLEWYEEIRRRILKILSETSRASVLSIGISREELKARTMRSSSAAFFQFMLKELEDSELIELNAGTVTQFGQRARPTSEQLAIRQKILELFEERRLEPPSMDELVSTLGEKPSQVEEVFHFLVKQGELVRVASDLVVSAQQIKILKAGLLSRFQRGQSFSVADFKDLFDLSRKYAIPILEFLDREKVTRRVADRRIIV